jgi:polysaccharide biosynthesis transport protein
MLAYSELPDRAEPNQQPAAPRHFRSFSALELFRWLWKRSGAIALAALTCSAALVAIGEIQTPVYTASAEIYVDPHALHLADRELAPSAKDASGLAMVVESQARLMTSNSVLLQVIRNIHLDKDPEFEGASRGGVAALLRWFGGGSRSAQDSAEIAALKSLNGRISISKPEHSSIIGISVASEDPAKAVMLANAIAHAYLVESRRLQAVAARQAVGDLSGPLKELQDRLRDADDALAIYKAQNNFADAYDAPIDPQQLTATNQRLAAARARALNAQARYDQIEASRSNLSDAGAMPQALQSPALADLRAQYAEARRRYAELKSELGPRHPALAHMAARIEELRRTLNEEVERFEQSAKSDLTHARDYEALLNGAIAAQKRQSVERLQASARLHELERDVEASRDAYQSFLKRSREIEEQVRLTPSIARIVGEATLPQRRSFPPAMSLLAYLGLLLGALGALVWFIVADRPSSDASELQAADPEAPPLAPDPEPAPEVQPRQQAAVVSMEKPLIARLQESDVARTLAGILTMAALPDLTRMGWPTLRAGLPLKAFLHRVDEMRVAVAKRAPADAMPVMAVIGAGGSEDRSIAMLNLALAVARNGGRVLMIDADHATRILSSKVNGPGKHKSRRFGLPRIAIKASRPIKTANGISVLPLRGGSDTKASIAIRKAIAQARAKGGYDLVILDGPPMPWSAADRKLLDVADGLVAVLPVSRNINGCVQDIMTALNGNERKLIGIVLDELNSPAVGARRDRQYA